MKNTTLLLTLFLLSSTGFCQIAGECFDLSYNNQLGDISALKALEKHKVFFLGETHNVGANDLMDYSLLTYLNRTQQVTHFIKEATYSYNFILSKYIETADPHFIDLLGTDFSVAEEREMLERLITYNKSVPKNQKIKLYGIDSEPFYHLPIMIEALVYLHGVPPKPVAETFDLLKSLQTKSWSYDISKKDKQTIKKIWQEISPIVSENENVFQEYLKDDFIHLKMVLNNSATLNRSDDNLFKNFLKLQKLTNSETFYLSYGSLHSQKKGSWLANQINNSLEFGDKVFTVKTIYHNSTFLWRGDNLPLNTLEKNNEEEQNLILKPFETCEFDFTFLSTEGLSYEGEFDLLLLCRNQKGITLEER